MTLLLRKQRAQDRIEGREPGRWSAPPPNDGQSGLQEALRGDHDAKGQKLETPVLHDAAASGTGFTRRIHGEGRAHSNNSSKIGRVPSYSGIGLTTQRGGSTAHHQPSSIGRLRTMSFSVSCGSAMTRIGW